MFVVFESTHLTSVLLTGHCPVVTRAKHPAMENGVAGPGAGGSVGQEYFLAGAVARVTRSGVRAAVSHALSPHVLAPCCITSPPPSRIAMEEETAGPAAGEGLVEAAISAAASLKKTAS